MTGAFDFGVDVERLRRRRTVKWSLHGPDVLAAWVAEMDFKVAPVVRPPSSKRSIARTSATCLPTGRAHDACADFLTRAHGWSVRPDRIFPVADVLTGIATVLEVFVEPGSPVILPTPAYPPFFDVISLAGNPIVPVPMVDVADRLVLDLDAVDAALGAGASTVLLCSPHNPTGRVYSEEEHLALAAVVEAHGARVIVDEVHAPLVHPGHRHVPYASLSETTAAHAITVMSASKAWNIPGLRCAQVVLTARPDAARWRTLPGFQVPPPAPLGIATSIAAFRHGDPWRAELLSHLDTNRHLLGALLAAELPEVAYRAPEGTYLAWLDCRALGVEDPAELFLAEGRVALNDGRAFGDGYEQHVRLNTATSVELLEQIVAGMARAAHSTR